MVFFSVVIPLYNKARYIENTIKSVLNQTFTDYEIIIINDESTDESEALVRKLNDERIQIFNQKNQGVSVARNLGIEKSKGKLIAFLDADDYWFSNHLEELAHLYHHFPDCGIYCSRYKIKTSKNHFQTPYYFGVEESFRGVVKDYFASNIPFRITWTSSLAIPKQILETFRGFTPGVTNGQDLELWTKIGIQFPIAITNNITAIYNNDIPESLAKKNINSMNLMDFTPFKSAEQENPSLKKFLDLYRIEYGFKYYIFGYQDKSSFYLKDLDKQNISLKIRFLLNMPPFCLRFLFKSNRLLKKWGINFSVYH
ncbi:glycosyltransferase family 2 protein [Flavobacterium sp. CSZ]|uniref:glycosyltransferase family 2 protein n=1 Tax=Flavobacterium sp. CSZ TaxID=2783791 RepID=UPI00188BF8B1|nr:glycosyltransferase family 2 protein [Flavobacterium sp. CSZ]MBF4485233.1 glycosyltransferase family 2 protein [Flavobacterium sp. CSZ]